MAKRQAERLVYSMKDFAENPVFGGWLQVHRISLDMLRQEYKGDRDGC